MRYANVGQDTDLIVWVALTKCYSCYMLHECRYSICRHSCNLMSLTGTQPDTLGESQRRHRRVIDQIVHIRRAKPSRAETELGM